MGQERLPTDPVLWHERNHAPLSFRECRRCLRQAVRCMSKRTYPSFEAADEAVRELNEREEYRWPVVRYRCRWCLLWHLTTATRKEQLRRVEKQRRKWLAARGLSVRGEWFDETEQAWT